MASACFIGAVGWEVLDIWSPNHLHLGTTPAHTVNEKWATAPRGLPDAIEPLMPESEQHSKDVLLPESEQPAPEQAETAGASQPARTSLLSASSQQEESP